jgi:hypothetical protein
MIFYDDQGRKVAEVAECKDDPKFTWIEFFIGILGALVALHLMVI